MTNISPSTEDDAKRLLHYTGAPLDLDRTRTYVQGRRFDKPTGLWVSCEGPDDWREWCEREDFGDLRCCSEIILASNANILRLSEADTVSLARRYPKYTYWNSEYPYPDWHAIADQYDGILIPTYWWSCRMLDTTFWYYGWDCASGCIWNLSAVESVRAIEPAVSND